MCKELFVVFFIIVLMSGGSKDIFPLLIIIWIICVFTILIYIASLVRGLSLLLIFSQKCVGCFDFFLFFCFQFHQSLLLFYYYHSSVFIGFIFLFFYHFSRWKQIIDLTFCTKASIKWQKLLSNTLATQHNFQILYFHFVQLEMYSSFFKIPLLTHELLSVFLRQSLEFFFLLISSLILLWSQNIL